MFLSKTDRETIHEAALKVLENTGVKITHQEGRELFLSGGCKADGDRILIPSSVVSEARKKAPSIVSIYDREGNSKLSLGNGETYFGSGSDALYNVNPSNGEIDKSTLADVIRNVKLVEQLDQYDFVMSMGLPSDIDANLQYATIFSATTQNTTKPIVVTSTCVEELQKIHEISQIITDGENKPFWLVYLEPRSPLKFDDACVERVLFCAQNSIPFMFAAGANCAGGAPVTTVGGVVQGCAESLAGLVLASFCCDKVSFVFGANTSSSDMRTGIVCYGAPEWAKTVSMYAEMGEFYSLPTWGTAGCTDAKEMDAQAGMEAYESILLALQSGVSLAHDVAYQVHGCLYDCRMLIMCNEMIKRAKFVLKTPSPDEENLALSTIDEVARGEGIYLTHQHTFKNFKESLWLPPKYIFRGKVNSSPPPIAERINKELEKLMNKAIAQDLSQEKTDKINALLM